MFAERPQYILLPVRIGTIVLSFIVAMLLLASGTGIGTTPYIR